MTMSTGKFAQYFILATALASCTGFSFASGQETDGPFSLAGKYRLVGIDPAYMVVDPLKTLAPLLDSDGDGYIDELVISTAGETNGEFTRIINELGIDNGGPLGYEGHAEVIDLRKDQNITRPGSALSYYFTQKAVDIGESDGTDWWISGANASNIDENVQVYWEMEGSGHISLDGDVDDAVLRRTDVAEAIPATTGVFESIHTMDGDIDKYLRRKRNHIYQFVGGWHATPFSERGNSESWGFLDYQIIMLSDIRAEQGVNATDESEDADGDTRPGNLPLIVLGPWGSTVVGESLGWEMWIRAD